MLRNLTQRRAPSIVVLALLMVAIIGGIAAVSVASTHVPDKIVLITGADGPARFEYGDVEQLIEPINSDCDVDTDINSAGLVVVSAATYDKKGRFVDPAKIGLVEDGIGVNQKGKGNGQDCGRTDVLDGANSEALILTLGPSVTGQLMSHVTMDVEAKQGAEIVIEFKRFGASLGFFSKELSLSSDDGPDSKYHDKFTFDAEPPIAGDLFDTIIIRMKSGGVALEGGATWEFSDESPDDHRTVFHLVETAPGVEISGLTNGADPTATNPNYIEVGTPSSVTWTYLVTNTGTQRLDAITVTDSELGTIACSVNTLDPGASMTCTVTGDAVPGAYANTADVEATSEFGQSVGDSDESGYFGSVSAISLVKTTTGSNDDGVYAGPDDDIFISKDDTVTWIYLVTNGGNVQLTGVNVFDAEERRAASCPDTILDPSESVTCTLSGIAETSEVGGGYSNSATAYGDPPVGATAEDSDTSSYFGSNPMLFVEVTNDNAIGDPPVVSDSVVIWTIFARNDGNVPIKVIVASEDVPEGDIAAQCDIAANLDPGESDDCTLTVTKIEGPQTTSFTVTGTDPLGTVVEESSGTVGYYGGFDCGESTFDGGPDGTDDPLAGFFVGPLKVDAECAVPIVIDTQNNLDDVEAEQTVFIGPPDGYSWTGVTGLLTVEWDVEDPSVEGVRSTLQRIVDGTTVTDSEIPECVGDVAIAYNEPAPDDFIYILVDNPLTANGTYPNATAGGDICLVRHVTETITFDQGSGTTVVKSRTVELFYVYSDPILSRPR